MEVSEQYLADTSQQQHTPLLESTSALVEGLGLFEILTFVSTV